MRLVRLLLLLVCMLIIACDGAQEPVQLDVTAEPSNEAVREGVCDFYFGIVTDMLEGILTPYEFREELKVMLEMVEDIPDMRPTVRQMLGTYTLGQGEKVDEEFMKFATICKKVIH